MRRLPLAVALAGLAGLAAGCGDGDDRAPAQTSPATTAVVWAVGDGGTGNAAARRVVARIRRGPVDRVLFLGDVYERGTAAEFRRRFEPVYRPLLSRTMPTPGNHEWPRRRQGYNPFWRRVHGRAQPPWYAFSLGGWRFISLNSQAPHGPRSAQLRWLRRELRRGDGTCRIAFWHRPRFSAGRQHGDQPDVAPLWDALRGNARLVLSGHDHDLQRFRPVGGLTQLVSGAGGRAHDAVRHGDRRLAFSDDRAFGAVRLELREGAADVAFVAADGRVLDRSSVSCRS